MSGSPASGSPAALDLTVVIPAFDEAARLGAGIERFRQAAAEGAVDLDRTELVLVDDGSTDGTSERAKALLADLPHHRVVRLAHNRGKGAAVRAGVSVARGTATAYMDADFAIDPRAIPLLLEALGGSDVAIGSRTLADSMIESRYLVRSLLSRLFNRLVTVGTSLDLHDTQCGFKAFRTPAARLLFHLVRIDGFAFDVELLARAVRLGLEVTEVPVQWKHVPGSSIHPLQDSAFMLADVYRSRWGLDGPPPVPALLVRAAPTHRGQHPGTGRPDLEAVRRALYDAAGGTPLPVVDRGDDVLALLPLVEPERVPDIASALGEALPGVRVTRRPMTFAGLRALGPLAGRLAPAPGVGPDGPALPCKT